MNDTLITARLDNRCDYNDNLIYCATVNLTWNELSDFKKGVVTLPEPCPTVDFLNRRTFNKGHLDERCYLACASLVSDGILQRIPRELQERFGETSRVNLDPANYRGDDILAYSFLRKILTFQKKFQEVENHLFRTSPTSAEPVKAFGIRKAGYEHREMIDQVRIHAYDSPGHFVVSLDTGADLMVLAMFGPEATLGEILTKAESRVKDPSTAGRMSKGESLVIPKLAFDLEHHFDEMRGQNLKVDGELSGDIIADAVQFIKFSLDEEGAKLRSEMAIHTFRYVSMNDFKEPRQFIFDEPFLIYLKEKPEYPPYFVAWIGNTGVMKPVRSS